ncbi:hypothetical protein EON80_11905, partial [bacterium]
MSTQTFYTEKIRDLNEKIKANPQDGFSLSWRAVQWAKCDALFHVARESYYRDRGLWLSLLNEDIAKAVEVAPKDATVYQNIVVAMQLASNREIRDNSLWATISPESAATMKKNLAHFEEIMLNAFQSGVDLGDPKIGGAKAWFLLKKIARSDEAARPALLGELSAAAKLSPDDVTAILCRSAGFSVWALRPEIRAAAAKDAEAKIDALALAQPQETHDGMSRVARMIRIKDGDIARQWQERAAAIPGVKICPDNKLLAYTFK